MDEPEDQNAPRDYVWFQTPWRSDWYQWVFVLALGFWLNLTLLLISGKFGEWLAKLDF